MRLRQQQRRFLEQARIARALLGSDVELVCAKVEDIPAERRFSIAAIIGGLYHVDDPKPCLSTRPGWPNIT